MGLYIEPQQDKRDWLNNNGVGIAVLPKSLAEISPDQLPVALIDNVAFLAGSVAFNQRELDYWNDSINRGDSRKMTFYLVDKEKLKDVCPQFDKYARD